jgi:tape measure domain-containing protein
MAKDISVALELNSKQFDSGIKQSTTSVKQFGNTSKASFAKAATAAAALTAAFAGLRKGLNVTASFQDLRSSLTTVFGGLEQGAAAFDRVTDIASKTQFQVQDIAKAFIQLKASGIEPTEAKLLNFAKASAVAVDQLGAFESAIRLTSRSAAGVIGLEELNSLEDRGVAVFKIIQEQLGLARDEINEFSKGVGNTQIVLDALAKGIEEKYGTALANRFANTNQRISNFNDQVSILADSLLAGMNEGFGEMIANLTEILKQLNKSTDAILDFGRALFIVAGIAATTFAGTGLLLIFNNVTLAGTVLTSVIRGLVKAFKLITGITAATAALKAHRRITGALTMETELLTLAQRKNLRIFAGGAALVQFTGLVIGLTAAYKLYQDVLERRETKLIEAIVGEGREKVEQEITDLANKVLDLTEAMNLYYETTRFSTRPVGITLGLQASEIDKLQKRVDRLRASLADMPLADTDEDDDTEKKLTTLDKINDVTKDIGKNFRSPKQFKIFVDELMALKGELKSNEDFEAFEKAYKNIESSFNMKIKPDLTAFQEIKAEIGDVDNFETYNAVLNKIKRSYETGDISLKEYELAVASLSEGFTGAEMAMAIFQDAFKDLDTAISNDLVDAIFEGENAIDSLKATFKEAIKQMIADTIRLMIVQTALQSIFGFFGYQAKFTPGGGIESFAKKRAMGGPVMKNKPYIVGEKGPELFVPGASGGIVPNHKMGGTGSQTINYNIQAIDTASFQARIAQDPQFLHAVVSKGANDLPSGRRF